MRRGRNVEADDPEEQRQRPGQRVDEELDRRSRRIAVSPNGDDEVHTDQTEIPEDEEEEEVQREEHPERGRLEKEEETVVGALASAQVERIRHRDRKEQRAERHQRQRDAIHPDLVADAERRDPLEGLDHGRQWSARVAQPDDEGGHQGTIQRPKRDPGGSARCGAPAGRPRPARPVANGDHGSQHARASIWRALEGPREFISQPPQRRLR